MRSAGVVVSAPPASASTVWNFPDGTIAVEDSISHAPAEVRITGLQITDGNVTAGSVQLSGQQTFCTTRSFSGNSAVFSDLGAFGCTGSLEFSVSPTGQLSVSTQALGGARLVVSGNFSSSIVGTMPAPTVVPLSGCTATLDDAAQTVTFGMTGGNPDAARYEVIVSGGILPTTTFLPQDVPIDLGADYSFLVSGQPVFATIEAKRADGMVVATCTTNAVTPWRAPGAPKVDSTVPVIGGLVTINYSVADPTTVQGIEYRLDNAGSWIRPGGTAPTGGVGGAFTVSGLADGNHTVTLRTVGFDPNSLTTLGTDESFDIPTAPKKPNGATRPSQGTAVVAIGYIPNFRAENSGAIAGESKPIVVGSKDFTESIILAEILAQMLEKRGLHVTRKFELGGNIAHETRTVSIAIFDSVQSLDDRAAHVMSAALVMLSVAGIALIHWATQHIGRRDA